MFPARPFTEWFFWVIVALLILSIMPPKWRGVYLMIVGFLAVLQSADALKNIAAFLQGKEPA